MGNSGSRGGSSRRQKAAAAQAQAMSAERRRERLVRIVGGAVVAATVVGIIGVAVAARSSSPQPGVVAADPAAPAPAGTLPADDPNAFGIPYGKPNPVAPQLVLWEDFQCPACRTLEAANGSGITGLADAGEVNLIWRPTAFLDRNLRNDASVRATAAWGCAIDQGATREFHEVVYANQPEREGDGYTDAQLLEFGAQAGLEGAGLEEFTQCVADGTYKAWAANSTKEFLDAEVPGTPHGILNGTPVGNDILADPVKLNDALAAASR